MKGYSQGDRRDMGTGAGVPVPHFDGVGDGMRVFNALARHQRRRAAQADAAWADLLESVQGAEPAVRMFLRKRYEKRQARAWQVREVMAALVARRGAEMVLAGGGAA